MKTKRFQLKVGELEKWIRETEVMYASGEGLRLFVKLMAAPELERYVIKRGEETVFKTKNRGDAVRKFNELIP